MPKKTNSLTVSTPSNTVPTVNNPLGMLTNPGDNLSARITNTNRKVLKVETENGNSKYSATQYPNGTIVETKTTKKK